MLTRTRNEADGRDPSSWRSVTHQGEAAGYSVFESEDRFWRERAAEGVLRIVGVLAILAGYVQWFLPAELLDGDPIMARMGLSALFMGVGFALYIFASRGFRMMLNVDLTRRRIGWARLNARNLSPVRRTYPMDRVEGFFVQRGGSGPQAMASLRLRLKGGFGPVVLLHGEAAEIEALHRQIVEDMHTALNCAPKRVQRRHRFAVQHARARPNRRRRRVRSADAAT